MHRTITTVLACALVAAALAFVPATAPASATTAATCKPTAKTAWAAAVKKAQTALGVAATSVQNHNYDRAVTKLKVVRNQVRIASTGATGLIGKPPTDPESDDPPGPPAVLKVAGLEHQVTMKLVPLLDGLRGRAMRKVDSAVNVADACRDVMLGTVLALKPAKIDDYADGLSDTLPSYKKELTTFSNVLATADLSARSRSAMQRAQQVVTKTSAAMNKQFGGGERPTS